MYKPDIGDPVEAARSRQAQYLLLVTVHEMASSETGESGLAGTPVRARIEAEPSLIAVEDGRKVWSARLADEQEGADVLPVDREILYTDTVLGALAERTAGSIALQCASAAGAGPAEIEGAPEAGDAAPETGAG